jgi:hypothetical protein
MRRILLLACLLSACVTSSSTSGRQEITGLEEMSLEYIQGQWGEPDYSLPKRTGRTVKFEKIYTRDEDPVSNMVTERICIIRLEIDKDGLVEQWDYESCVDRNPSKKQTKAAIKPDTANDELDIEGRDAPEIFDLDGLPSD